MQPSPAEVMAEVQDALTTLPACLAGSVVSAETYGLPLASTSDVDVFCYNEAALFVGVQRLLNHDFTWKSDMPRSGTDGWRMVSLGQRCGTPTRSS